MAGEQSSDNNTRPYSILAEGVMVGRYRIIEKIGAGGMGEVYLVAAAMRKQLRERSNIATAAEKRSQ